MNRKRSELLTFGYLRNLQNTLLPFHVPLPIYNMIQYFHSSFNFIHRTVTIHVHGNQDNRVTAINQYLCVHGTRGDAGKESEILLISHKNQNKKGIWRIEPIANHQFVIRHIQCFDGRKMANDFYLAFSTYVRDGQSMYSCVQKDVNSATKVIFIPTEDFENDVFYIETVPNSNETKQYLSIHASNTSDKRDKNSCYVHFRINDHKATKWKFESINSKRNLKIRDEIDTKIVKCLEYGMNTKLYRAIYSDCTRSALIDRFHRMQTNNQHALCRICISDDWQLIEFKTGNVSNIPPNILHIESINRIESDKDSKDLYIYWQRYINTNIEVVTMLGFDHINDTQIWTQTLQQIIDVLEQ